MHFDSDIFGRRPSGLNATLALGPQYRVPVDGLGHMQATGPQYVVPVTGLGAFDPTATSLVPVALGAGAGYFLGRRKGKSMTWALGGAILGLVLSSFGSPAAPSAPPPA